MSATLSRRRVLAAIALLSTVTIGSVACATSPPAPPLVTLSVVDRDSGQTLTTYAKDARSFVAGTPGSRYALRLSNRSGGRVLVVLSVDGINVVSGETAAWGQVGYVLEPWRSHDIIGWRKSDTQVAAFEFASLRQSYAALTGRPGNVGVIGMAVFAERVPEPPAPPFTFDDSVRRIAPAAPAAAKSAEAADAAGARLGTAHGGREWSVSRRTSFERASDRPQSVTEIWYDSRENLVAAGVIPSHVAEPRRAFPRSDVDPGYVPDPPRY